MSRFFTTRGWLGVRSTLVLCMGILMLAVAVAQKPVDPLAGELICIYFDELDRADSDYLAVGVLPGAIGPEKSKEVVVVNLFPPGNDGTRKGLAGGGSLLPAVQSARDHVRRMSCVKNIKQIALGVRNYAHDDMRYLLRRMGTRSGPAGGGGGDRDVIECEHCGATCTEQCRCSPSAKAGTKNMPTQRLVIDMFPPGNMGTRTGPAGGGDRDVIECERCGASCTEPCRCNPTGFELIFGNTDDELVDMQIESDYLHLLFVTCYGMRSVRLYRMEADSNQTLVIAKGWRDHGLTVCPRVDESTDGKKRSIQ